jgi:hypothetical protein
MELALLVVRIRHRYPTPTLPANTKPPVRLIQIDGPSQHQQPGSDRVITTPALITEPSTGDHPGTFDTDIIPALRNLTKMIDQRLHLAPSWDLVANAECCECGLIVIPTA